MAKKIKKTIDGLLPSRKWLLLNGYIELVKCMDEHPELFAHIPQNKKGRK